MAEDLDKNSGGQAEEAKSTSEEGKVGSITLDPETINKIKETLSVPVPEKDEFWRIEGLASSDKADKKILGIFKKKTLGVEEINDLRKSALQSPGNTRTKIAKLKKQYPDSPILYMLSAICTHGMLMNSSNQREVMKGLKIAAKEGAIALVSNGISVYNCENFFRIYFALIDRLKRIQIRNYEMVNQDPRLEGFKQQLIIAMRAVDQLNGEKLKIFNLLNFLKKKLKSSQYTTVFSFHFIREAIKRLELGTPKEKVLVGTANEVIAYVYALAVAFARTPILWPLVDEITHLMPDSIKSLLVRRISINSVRNFTKFRLAAIEGDREKMSKLGKTIMKENMIGVQKLDGQSLYQSYETDPFFNLAFIAELTVGLYKEDDHKKIIQTAIQALGLNDLSPFVPEERVIEYRVQGETR